MIFEENTKALKIGFKQVMRAVTDNNAAKIYIAEDCEDRFKSTLEAAVSGADTEIIYASTMKELGKMCNIDVGASCAVVCKN